MRKKLRKIGASGAYPARGVVDFFTTFRPYWPLLESLFATGVTPVASPLLPRGFAAEIPLVLLVLPLPTLRALALLVVVVDAAPPCIR